MEERAPLTSWMLFALVMSFTLELVKSGLSIATAAFWIKFPSSVLFGGVILLVMLNVIDRIPPAGRLASRLNESSEGVVLTALRYAVFFGFFHFLVFVCFGI
jgi:hypothetical protein